MEHTRQHPNLLGEVVVINLIRSVEWCVDKETRVVDSDKGQCRRARSQDQLAVDRYFTGYEGLPTHTPFRADAIDENVAALITQLATDLARIVHKILAEGRKVALVVKTAIAVPDA